MKKDALRVVATIPVAPTTLYLAWLNSEHHSSMTGGKAKLEADVGTKYSAWDGYISGKLITLDLGRRIIMSWRTTDFPRDASDSRVEVHFEALGGNTRVTILHTEIPEGQGEKYKSGWVERYFDPMRRYFSQYLPDPRKPPPPRPPPPPMDYDEEEEEEETPKAKGKGAKLVPAKLVPAKPGAKPGGKPVAPVGKAAAAKAPPAKAAPAKAAPAKATPAKAAPAKAPAAKAKPTPKPAPKAKPKPVAKKPAKPAPKPAKKAAKRPAKPAKPAKKKKR